MNQTITTSMTINQEISELEEELEHIKQRVNMGHELKVQWHPGEIRKLKGKRLQGEVKGDLILVYVEDYESARAILRHEFMEWVFNQHSRSYQQLVNKLITLFEEQQYERKERIVDALARLI